MAFRIPPTPEYKRELAQLESYYKKAFKRIVQLLKNVDPNDLLRQQLFQSIIRQLTFIINDLNEESRKWFEDTLTDAFGHAQASALVTMGLAKDIVQAKGEMNFSLMSRQRIEAIINDTFQDVLKAHSIMSEELKQLVRDVQAEVLRVNVALQRGTVTSAKEMKTKFLEKGFSKDLLAEKWQGITDAGGRRWDLTTYTNMVARTKLQQVQIEGAKQTALENDTDLAIISSHGAKDSCSHFEGLIISLFGRTRGYKTLDEVRNTNLIFHPNCQHSVHPIGDVDALPEVLKTKARKAEASASYAMTHADEIKKESSRLAYQEKKEKLRRIKEQRKKALEKARKVRARKT